MFPEILDWLKIYKTVLGKAFFFILWRLNLFFILVLLKSEISFLEVGHIGFK
jgi:hypothetical protein